MFLAVSVSDLGQKGRGALRGSLLLFARFESLFGASRPPASRSFCNEGKGKKMSPPPLSVTKLSARKHKRRAKRVKINLCSFVGDGRDRQRPSVKAALFTVGLRALLSEIDEGSTFRMGFIESAASGSCCCSSASMLNAGGCSKRGCSLAPRFGRREIFCYFKRPAWYSRV